MKTRLWGVLAGIVVLSLLAVTVTACGGGTKATVVESSPANQTDSQAGRVTVTTLAGQAGFWGSADGSGPAARFYWPSGIARDFAGNLYVADSENNTIRKITPAGVVTTLAGKADSPGWADGIGASARFSRPSGIVCGAFGNRYVADTGNDTIRRISPAGKVTTLAGQAGSAARFNHPVGIALDTSGIVYVTDTENHTVCEIMPGGSVMTLAGLSDSPGSADGSGSAARFDEPHGIACDTDGNLYVADFGSNTIRKITPFGEVSTLAGKAYSAGSTDGSGSAARFSAPWGITCDSAGNLYVTDSGNDTIRMITPDGEATTVAGKAGSEGSADGSGTVARFNHPYGIVWHYYSNLYVADGGNHTIREITLSH